MADNELDPVAWGATPMAPTTQPDSQDDPVAWGATLVEKEEPEATIGSIATQVPAGIGEGVASGMDAAFPPWQVAHQASRGLNKAFGTPVLPSQGEMAKKVFGLVGANPDDYPAQNAPERITRFASSMIPSAAIPASAPARIAGFIPAATRVAGRIGSQIAGGLTGGAAGELVPEQYRPAAQAVGSVVGGGLVSGMKDAITAGGQSVARDRLTQTAADLDVTMPRVLTTPSIATQRVGTALSNVPLAGEPIFESVKNSVEGVGRAADKVRAGYGSGNMEASGAGAKDAIAKWILGPGEAADIGAPVPRSPTGSRAVTDRVYSKVDELVDPAHYGDPAYTRNALGDIVARTENAGIPRGPMFQAVLDRVQEPRGMNYEALKDMRTWIGQHMDNKLLPSDIPRQFLKPIYMGLTNDIRRVVRDGGGQEALTAWNKANSTASNVAARREALAGIVGVKGDANPAQVFDRLAAYATTSQRADTHRLLLARKTMGPQAWNEVASAIIAKTIVGKDKMTFSPEHFVTEYGKLSPAGKNILFRSTGKGELADALDKVLYVSREIGARHTKFGNPSGSGRTVMGALGLSSAFVSPWPFLASLAGTRGVAYYLATPHRATATAEWLQAHQSSMLNPNVMTNSILERATRNLLGSGVASEGGLQGNP